MNCFRRDAKRIEERSVLDGVTPQIDGVGVKPVLAGEQGTGNAGARSKVTDAGSAGDICIAKQLFTELEGVGPHDLRAHERRVEAVGFWEGMRFQRLHCSFLSGAMLADDGAGTAQQITAARWPFSYWYAINRSLKNNDQKDIPLDDRNWAETRDAFIVERCARAGVCHL